MTTPSRGQLEDDIRGLIVADMQRANLRGLEQLTGATLDQLVLAYFNWLDRLVPASPRKVHVSRELFHGDALRDKSRGPAIRRVLDEIEAGENLDDRLSYLTQFVAEPSKRRKRIKSRRDLDLMLNDWGVHHLHCGSRATDGRVSRSDELLFVSFTAADAYVIDVMPHVRASWTAESVLETLARNWPDEGVIFGAGDAIVGLAADINQDARTQLRYAGANTFIQVDGRVFMPRGGLTLGGTSMRARMRANSVAWALSRYEQRIADDPGWLRRELEQAGADATVMDCHFTFTQNGFGIVDGRSGVFLPLA